MTEHWCVNGQWVKGSITECPRHEKLDKPRPVVHGANTKEGHK